MKLHLVTCHSPPAAPPSFQQAMDWYWSTAPGMGTPDVVDVNLPLCAGPWVKHWGGLFMGKGVEITNSMW